ncbi:hypothetical protein SAMN05216304_104220 [Bosea sp. OK403]|uniref:hypothetical protein n=1 Tax=Bosea sp. OK403 TaxID=1855286 RepID=UPI0008E0C854|nr:hypothetical protein [Bosea sp. OK403]SFJ03927.1 hypothetical protein SAMN05216304_104220 [Bosea sp. OK403]
MSGVSVSPARPDQAARRLHSRLAVRAPLLVLAAVALLTGLCGGFGRLGLNLPHTASLAELHGPLLVSGLFGTLISLERAVAINRGWAYCAPALSGLGTLALLAGAPIPVGAGAYALAAGSLAAGSLVITIRQPALFTGTLLVGALAWLAGNLLWATGRPIADVVGWWLAFLVLTIAAERLELSRLVAPKWGGEALFLFALGMLLVGAQNGVMTGSGSTLFGMALLSITVWLLRHDIAWLSIRRTGQTRFMAACMLAGYVWLAVAGVALIAGRPGTTMFGYDIALHAILIGFVLSMVFGHALIILPAVVRLRLRYTPALYAPLFLLHGAVALRVGSGLAEWEVGRASSGALTALALFGFALALLLPSRHPRASVVEVVEPAP